MAKESKTDQLRRLRESHFFCNDGMAKEIQQQEEKAMAAKVIPAAKLKVVDGKWTCDKCEHLFTIVDGQKTLIKDGENWTCGPKSIKRHYRICGMAPAKGDYEKITDEIMLKVIEDWEAGNHNPSSLAAKYKVAEQGLLTRIKKIKEQSEGECFAEYAARKRVQSQCLNVYETWKKKKQDQEKK